MKTIEKTTTTTIDKDQNGDIIHQTETTVIEEYDDGSCPRIPSPYANNPYGSAPINVRY